MSKLSAFVDTAGTTVIKLDDMVAYLNTLKTIAHWRTGEQMLTMIKDVVEGSHPPVSAPILTS